MVLIHDQSGIEGLRKRAALQPHGLKRFRNAFLKKGLSCESALAVLPEDARALFEREVCFHSLKLSHRQDSKVDGATKLGFLSEDGHMVESVILRVQSGRTSLCISSQVGCACACGFCATGQMGLTRNLTYAEILDQVVQANQLLREEGRSVRNVVFMGMGEPFMNQEHLFRALEILTDPLSFDYAGSRLMVSTVGIPDVMLRCAREFPEVRQALSLHSARQDVRETLIPLAKKYHLDLLREALLAAGADGELMVEYLMLAGINDREEDLLALESYLRDCSVHINIVPYNAFDGCAWQGTAPAAREAFANRLKAAGFKVTQRYSLGADIAAACGQLASLHRQA